MNPTTTRDGDNDMLTQLKALPREAVLGTLRLWRMPLELAESTFAKESAQQAVSTWPPAVAFDRVASSVAHAAGVVLNDEILLHTATVKRAKVAQIEHAVEAEQSRGGHPGRRRPAARGQARRGGAQGARGRPAGRAAQGPGPDREDPGQASRQAAGGCEGAGGRRGRPAQAGAHRGRGAGGQAPPARGREADPGRAARGPAGHEERRSDQEGRRGGQEGTQVHPVI